MESGNACGENPGGVTGVDDWQEQQMVLTGGQMKHTKTGHVTLLK